MLTPILGVFIALDRILQGFEPETGKALGAMTLGVKMAVDIRSAVADLRNNRNLMVTS